MEFAFGGRSYSDQLNDAIKKTKKQCAVQVHRRRVEKAGKASLEVVWVQHDFAFLGGSLGCAEGEKVTRAFEYGTEHGLCVVVACRTGGARLLSYTKLSSLMSRCTTACLWQ